MTLQGKKGMHLQGSFIIVRRKGVLFLRKELVN